MLFFEPLYSVPPLHIGCNTACHHHKLAALKIVFWNKYSCIYWAKGKHAQLTIQNNKRLLKPLFFSSRILDSFTGNTVTRGPSDRTFSPTDLVFASSTEAADPGNGSLYEAFLGSEIFLYFLYLNTLGSLGLVAAHHIYRQKTNDTCKH